MFKVGDLVKLKDHMVIDLSGYGAPGMTEAFLAHCSPFLVLGFTDNLVQLDTSNQKYYPYPGGIYFKPEYFELVRTADEINEQRPYSELTKLEYAAIHISADYSDTPEGIKKAVNHAKKLLEACNAD